MVQHGTTQLPLSVCFHSQEALHRILPQAPTHHLSPSLLPLPSLSAEPAISSPPLLQPLIPVLWMCGCNYRNEEDPVSPGICRNDYCKVGHCGCGSRGKVCPERDTDLHWDIHPCLLKDVSLTLKHPVAPAGCRPCWLSRALSPG